MCLRRSGMPSAVDELMTLAGLKASIAAASVCVCVCVGEKLQPGGRISVARRLAGRGAVSRGADPARQVEGKARLFAQKRCRRHRKPWQAVQETEGACARHKLYVIASFLWNSQSYWHRETVTTLRWGSLSIHPVNMVSFPQGRQWGLQTGSLALFEVMVEMPDDGLHRRGGCPVQLRRFGDGRRRP